MMIVYKDTIDLKCKVFTIDFMGMFKENAIKLNSKQNLEVFLV